MKTNMMPSDLLSLANRTSTITSTSYVSRRAIDRYQNVERITALKLRQCNPTAFLFLITRSKHSKPTLACALYEISDIRDRLKARDAVNSVSENNLGKGAILDDHTWESTRDECIKRMGFTDDQKLHKWCLSTRGSTSTYERRKVIEESWDS